MCVCVFCRKQRFAAAASSASLKSWVLNTFGTKSDSQAFAFCIWLSADKLRI